MDKKVKIGKSSIVLGTIIAPDALVSLGKKSSFKGAICAEKIEVKKGTTFLRHGSATSLPKMAPMTTGDEDLIEAADARAIPTEFDLAQNFPNPFNPTTTITFAVPKAGDVTLAIYNLRGRLVRTLAEGPLAAGQHKVVWDGNDSRGLRVASGIYVYRLEANEFVESKKLILAR